LKRNQKKHNYILYFVVLPTLNQTHQVL